MNKIASSGTIAGLTKLMNQYFYTDKYSISEDLKINHPAKDINEHFKVRHIKGRFLLYHI